MSWRETEDNWTLLHLRSQPLARLQEELAVQSLFSPAPHLSGDWAGAAREGLNGGGGQCLAGVFCSTLYRHT